MEIIDLHGIEYALGIRDPWGIRLVERSDDTRVIDVHLEIKNQKRFFGLLGGNTNKDLGPLVEGHWSHISLGNYRSVIHASIPLSFFDSDQAVSSSLINQYSFLGHPTRRYSNFIRQKVALFHVRDIEMALLSDIYHIDNRLINTILKDLSDVSERVSRLAFLPTENDEVWRRVLFDRQQFQTSLLPLKLLLSKLKLASVKDSSHENIFDQTLVLRKFIIANAHLLEAEIEQLSGISTEKSKKSVSVEKNRQSLILPSVKNPIWLGILNGKLKLNSQSLPLNLLISKLRMKFLQEPDTKDKVNCIHHIRDYFRKNYRTLKPELVLINRMLAIKEKALIDLPDVDHAIWQKILEGDDIVPSDHIAYKLLLARLRMQITSQVNPVVRLDAARYIREFILKNQKVMHKELSSLLMHSKAG